jgi:23S rRNA (cytidine1920-2'-O)/16S rRNA (cytidine1409-2'-O)-methyltransferase
MRERLDVLLVERGLVDNRSRAQALIRAGQVLVAGQVFDKPGMTVAVDAELVLRQQLPYVSRGGHKLAAAIDHFGLEVTDRVCLDVGASTGGFTDLLLQRSARRVYAVDVGHGQLAWSLRQDERVVNLERTDIRAVRSLPEPIDIAAIDVAFISLKLILPAVAQLLAPAAVAVILIKPQFEAGRKCVGHGGVVRDPEIHQAVLEDILGFVNRTGWRIADAFASPVRGGDGNREFLVLLGVPTGTLTALAVPDAVSLAMSAPSENVTCHDAKKSQ